jgi:hypothetical protein
LHKKDEATYKKHLFAFKKTFLNFIYHNLDISKPSSPIQKLKEAEWSGRIKDIQLEEPHNLRGGGHDTLIVVVEE